MLTEMARVDLERLKAAGHEATWEQVVRLNDYALRIERGKDTTAANLPRVAFAGNVVLHEPTVAALEWWHQFGRDAAWTTNGKLWTYYWMLAHATDAAAFEGLERAGEIRRRVRSWRRGVWATEGEIWRALMFVRAGWEGTEAPRTKELEPIEDDAAFERVWRLVIAAAGTLSMSPRELKGETQSTLVAMLAYASARDRRPIRESVAKDYLAYMRVYREIERNG